MSPARPLGAPDPEKDVVALLIQQHGEIRNLFDEVEKTKGDDRREAFHRLVRMLAVHETAEEEIVHPVARSAAEGGEQVVADRLEEERKAKEALSRLEHMDVEDAAFLSGLVELRMNVMKHARAEERYEFTQLRRMDDPKKLESMAKAVKAAEATAPTHPHPGTETAAGNIAVGPFAAIKDRVRDAIRDTRRKGS